MQTFVRMREQIHSNLIGLHVDSLAGADHRPAGGLSQRASAPTPPTSPTAAARGDQAAGTAVAQQAAVLSYIDGFLAAAGGAFVCLILTALLMRR